ncbi:MAG: DegT/DnrJ/EryC1/StrS family aminotransferase [Elusimicrobia bacterium]|nr:DegT/DnrJ/EryC1/StrS family aminotransferase [Elusimicrobiota bacterium]
MTSKTIPLMNLKAQYQGLARELRKCVLRALDSGAYILGPEGKAFEEEFAKSTGAKHAVGVSSGTSALSLALKAMGVEPGDEVIVPAFTFIATATAVSAVGAAPRLADVDPVTLTMDPESAAKAVTKRTKVLTPVHLYGQPADMDALTALARRRGLKVLEDCAQAHMTLFHGLQAGTMGDMAAFSFYPSKNLGAAGDAGAIVTGSERLAGLCRQLRHGGRAVGSAYEHEFIGGNDRLDDLQAAVLRVKLRHLASWIKSRRKLAAIYNEELSNLGLELPDLGQNGNKHSFHLFVIRTENRDGLMKHLQASGVGCGVYYPIPVHLQPAYRSLGYRKGDFPVAEQASLTNLALPLYPELKASEVRRVCKAVRQFFK